MSGVKLTPYYCDFFPYIKTKRLSKYFYISYHHTDIYTVSGGKASPKVFVLFLFNVHTMFSSCLFQYIFCMYITWLYIITRKKLLITIFLLGSGISYIWLDFDTRWTYFTNVTTKEIAPRIQMWIYTVISAQMTWNELTNINGVKGKLSL